MQAAHRKLVGILVTAGDAQVIGFLEGVCSGDGQGESFALTQILHRLVAGLQIQGDHVHIHDAAPGHHHYINAVVFIVSPDHVGRHREKIRFCSK